jgi:SAM-dependent methyltransferase
MDQQILDLLNKNLPKNELGIYTKELETKVSFPTAFQDEMLKIEESSFWFKFRNKIIARVVHKFFSKGTLLDVGSGNGLVSSYLMTTGITPIAIEPGELGSINSVRHRKLPYVIRSNVESLSFLKGHIPAIGIFDVLEHHKDDAGFLQVLHRLLNKDGYLFITVPAYQWLWSYEDEFAEHHRRYTITDIKKLLKENGFNIRYASYFFAWLVIPIFLVRVLSSKKGEQTQAQKHHSTSKFTQFILNTLNNIELFFINYLRLPLGSSIIVVAQKTNE